jgi:hypothetical protein
MSNFDRKVRKFGKAYELAGGLATTVDEGTVLTLKACEFHGRACGGMALAHVKAGASKGEALDILEKHVEWFRKVTLQSFELAFKDRFGEIWHPAKEGEEIIVQERKHGTSSNTD